MGHPRSQFAAPRIFESVARQTSVTRALLAAAFGAWLFPPAALAVPEGVASRTAEVVCELRALAARHPDPKLRSRDHLAEKLCRATFLPTDYAQARVVIDGSPADYAAFFYVNARTHHIDNLVESAAAQGITQVVVLGAGYDSRAYRFRDSHPKLRFYEVDLPATIALKKKRVARLLGKLPPGVRYAPIDFNTQSLDKVLRGAGYRASRKTLFILEGVTMYVNEAGNRATLGYIGKHAAPGSLLVYDYVLRQVIDGDFTGLYGARSTVAGVARVGEPYITGWTPRDAAAFAREQGLEVLADLGPEELTRRYLTGTDGRPDGRVFDWHRIIDAKVP